MYKFVIGCIFTVFFLVTGWLYLISLKSLSFHTVIKTDLPPDKLWEYLDQSFTDSTQSPYWPTDEEIHSSGIQNDNPVAISHRSWWKDDQTFYYTFSDVQKPYTFWYNTNSDDTIWGHGEVRILPSGSGSLLDWSYQFNYEGLSLATWYLDWYYNNTFFPELRVNLQKMENQAAQ